MALIKWKQLSKDLSTHANLTGSLKVTGSILLNGAAVSTAQTATAIGGCRATHPLRTVAA